MKWKKWLENWNMTNLKIKTSFLEMDLNFQPSDKDAAWELYIELLTRITTQEMEDSDGDEESALNSIYEIFDLTREIIKKYKRDCMEFTKIAIVVLNQIIRPFSSKWHRKMLQGLTEDEKQVFRDELRNLQKQLRTYTGMLGDMAGVEEINDLTQLEKCEE